MHIDQVLTNRGFEQLALQLRLVKGRHNFGKIPATARKTFLASAHYLKLKNFPQASFLKCFAPKTPFSRYQSSPAV
ncbi:hypothetical protein [Solibacillus sp.]|uniref:hypothetical protein n=1 Tax=Solibacillus sp. TaxID=1909654 RepID=UPI0033162EAD